MRKRILFVTGKLSDGGAERFVSTALVHLDRSKFEPFLGVFEGDISYELPGDVPLTVFGQTPGFQKLSTIMRLSRWISRNRPDVVVGSHWHPSMMLEEAMRFSRHRPFHVSWLVSNPLRSLMDGFSKRWFLRNHLRINRYVSVSHGVKRAFLVAYPGVRSEVAVLHNPIDTGDIARLAESDEAGPAAFPGRFLVGVGRLTEAKRFDEMIDAFSLLQTAHPGVSLVILGEGEKRELLEQKIHDMGLAGRVLLPGFTKNPYPWIKAAEVVVSTSHWEGFGIALAEAQALGKPVVATDCDYGPKEIILDGQTGSLVAVGDIAGIAEAIGTLLANPDTADSMGDLARRRAFELFDIGGLKAQLNEVLTP
jgi:glycosyltransferase involved in cell wall biosynthesis